MSLLSDAENISITIPENDTSKYDDLSYKLNRYSSACNFINNYMCYYRIPSLAIRTREHITNSSHILAIPSNELIEKYKKETDDLVGNANESIQDVCSKNNIESKCNNNQLLQLKEEIDEAKEKSINKIIDHYKNGISKMEYCSKGRVTDFMILDQYASLAKDYEYEDTNPFVVELYEILNEIIGNRLKVESSSINADALISKFNESCISAMGDLFKDKKTTFYDQISSRFKNDYYANSTSDLKANADDKNRVTLYSKALEYLQNLSNYTAPEESQMTFSSDIDYSDPSSITIPEKKTDKQGESLKKIAIQYVSLKNIIESNANGGNYNRSLSEYELNYNGEVQTTTDENGQETPIIFDTKYVKTYLASLKSITESEETKINALMNKVLNEYYTLKDEIDSGKIFENVASASLSQKGVVYKDNEQCDYYIARPSNTVAQTDSSELDLNTVQNPYTAMGFPEETTTAVDLTDIKYWIRYCAVATAVNCAAPIYWATGLITPTGPVLLPVILVPMVVIPGRIIIVIGMGICGISVLPMILFANIGCLPGSIVIPVNMLIDALRKQLKAFASKSINTTLKMSAVQTVALEQQIEQCDKDIESVTKKITEIRNMRKGAKAKRKILKKKRKELEGNA